MSGARSSCRPTATSSSPGVDGANQFAAARLLGSGSGGGAGPVPPAVQCPGGAVLAFVNDHWRCTRVSGIDDSLVPHDERTCRAIGHQRRSRRGARRPDAGLPRVSEGPGCRARFRRRQASPVRRGVHAGESRSAKSVLRGLAHGRRRIALIKGVPGFLVGHSSSSSTDIAIAFQTSSVVGLVRLRVRGRVSRATDPPRQLREGACRSARPGSHTLSVVHGRLTRSVRTARIRHESHCRHSPWVWIAAGSAATFWSNRIARGWHVRHPDGRGRMGQAERRAEDGDRSPSRREPQGAPLQRRRRPRASLPTRAHRRPPISTTRSFAPSCRMRHR